MEQHTFDNQLAVVLSGASDVRFSIEKLIDGTETDFTLFEYYESEESIADDSSSEDELLDEVLRTLMTHDPQFCEDLDGDSMYRGIGAYRKNIGICYDEEWNIFGLCELFGENL